MDSTRKREKEGGMYWNCAIESKSGLRKGRDVFEKPLPIISAHDFDVL